MKLSDRVRARISEIEARKAEIDAELNAIAADPEARGFASTDEALSKISELRSEGEALDGKLTEARADLAQTEDAESRQAAAAAVRPAIVTETGGARVKSEPVTYSKNGGHSHAKDLALSLLGRADSAAMERLQRNAREVEVETRAGSTTDTAGGTFVPPLWVLSEYVGVVRAGRAAADLARRLPLPGGTDSINIPTITTGTLTAVQATENSAITTQDMVTSSTTADVTTVAGYYDCSLQLLEQSALAGGFDQLVYMDLVKDYNKQLDTLVLSGTGSNNQPVGIATAAGTTVTVATAAGTALYQGIFDGVNRIATTRFESPEVLVMHPRRWFWLASRLDTSGRPLVTSDAQAAQNVLATMGLFAVEGVVGMIGPWPVVIDANVTTTSSTFFDEVYIWKASDAILMEGTPRLEAFRDILSSSLGVRFRLYNYAAFTARFTTSIAKVTGAGLTGPTF